MIIKPASPTNRGRNQDILGRIVICDSAGTEAQGLAFAVRAVLISPVSICRIHNSLVSMETI